MRTIQKGFTLIELMIVGCDHRHSGCGGAPAYQDYTVRRRCPR